jgi:hypothetical protein
MDRRPAARGSAASLRSGSESGGKEFFLSQARYRLTKGMRRMWEYRSL